jgi:hypothetical protein
LSARFVTGAAVKGQQLEAMRTLQLRAIANPLAPLAVVEHFEFDFYLLVDHDFAPK